MKRAILAFLLLGVTSAFAGDTPIYPFRLGDWDFQLSSVGDGHGKIVSALSATHPKRKIFAEATLDYRWYVLAATQFECGPQAAKPFFETLVGFAASEWRTMPGSADALTAMRESPPTLAYKQSFEFLTTKPK